MCTHMDVPHRKVWDRMEGYTPPPYVAVAREVENLSDVFAHPRLRRAGSVLALETIPLPVWEYLADESEAWDVLKRRAFGYEYDGWDVTAAAIRHLVVETWETRLDPLLTNPVRQWLWKLATDPDGPCVECLKPVRRFSVAATPPPRRTWFEWLRGGRTTAQGHNNNKIVELGLWLASRST